MPEFMNSKPADKGDEKPAGTDKTYAEKRYEDLTKPFVLKRKITIMPINNRSLYRQVNDKVMPKKVEYIGSSVRSSQILASNTGEVNAYFPKILGISANNENFITRLKQYLNNIQVRVDALGVQFDASFRFKTRSEYIAYNEELKKIEEVYNSMPKGTDKDKKAAINYKIDAINTLESELYLVGEPVNLDEYIMYRHCLLYSAIAKDTSLINGNPNIRFYFKDENKEATLQAKHRQEVNAAKRNYITAIGDDDLFRAVYVQYCVQRNMAIVPALADERINQETQLDKFSVQEPEKFNKICNDKDVRVKSDIELLIARGELIRSQFNQNITTATGEFVGANMKEAIAWYKNPENENIIAAFRNKIKFA